MTTEVKFKYDLYNRVETPLTKTGVVTMLAVNGDGNKTYYVENSDQGASDGWWIESQLKRK